MTEKEKYARCVKEEMEYREWRECPLWYCVKTIMNNTTGKMKSELVKDEKTGAPVAIQGVQKPEDGVYETTATTTYYTYHRGYDAAAKYMAAANM